MIYLCIFFFLMQSTVEKQHQLKPGKYYQSNAHTRKQHHYEYNSGTVDYISEIFVKR